jgi:predicted DNA-binding transcriptional regulator AlpA
LVLTKRQAAQLIGVSEHHIMRLAKQGRFPQPIVLTPRRIGFSEHEVRTWLENRTRGSAPDPFAHTRYRPVFGL